MESNKRIEFKKDPDNGECLSPDGCYYSTEAEAMYYTLGLCGCGQPENIHKFLIDCLGARKSDCEQILDIKKIEIIIKEKPNIVAEFVLHFLDSVQLTEHGSSVYGSWLTERGKQFLEIGTMEI